MQQGVTQMGELGWRAWMAERGRANRHVNGAYLSHACSVSEEEASAAAIRKARALELHVCVLFTVTMARHSVTNPQQRPGPMGILIWPIRESSPRRFPYVPERACKLLLTL
eukprot:515908-Pyramimonas_sp.AAC.1